MVDGLASHPTGRPLPRGRHGRTTGPAGLRLARRDARVGTIAARRGAAAAVADRLRDLVGVAPVDRPVAVTAGTTTFVGTAPGRWTVVSEAADVEAQFGLLADRAAVVDQTGGVVIYEAAGPALGDVLAALTAVDLHPSVFPLGSALTTTVAHIGVTAWGEAADRWIFLVGRSFALAFERAMVATAAAHGIELA